MLPVPHLLFVYVGFSVPSTHRGLSRVGIRQVALLARDYPLSVKSAEFSLRFGFYTVRAFAFFLTVPNVFPLVPNSSPRVMNHHLPDASLLCEGLADRDWKAGLFSLWGFAWVVLLIFSC